MDVRCEKCQTEYELDESRLKPGGVTVKCTNCGHMFKIRKRTPTLVPGAPPVASSPRALSQRPESMGLEEGPTTIERQWVIRLENGEQKTCRELATLQQWIVGNVVTREALISRTGKTWKRLGDIAELAQYFQIADEARRDRAVRGDRPTKPTGPKKGNAGTMLGVGPQAAGGTILPDDPEDDGDEDNTTGRHPAQSRPITQPPPVPGQQIKTPPMGSNVSTGPTNRRPQTQPPGPPPKAKSPTGPVPVAPVVSERAIAPTAPAPKPAPLPDGRSTAAWASDTIKATGAPPSGPYVGKLAAIPDEPAFAGRVRVAPSDEASFDTGRVSVVDDDDDLMPRRRGSSAGLIILLMTLVVGAGAAALVYVFIINKDDAPAVAVTADAAVTPDASLVVTPVIDADEAQPLSPLEAARAELAHDHETRLRDVLAKLPADDPAAHAVRANLGAAIAQSLVDRAGLVADKAEADKLRKESKTIVLEAATAAQRAHKAASDDPAANVAMANVLRLQGKKRNQIQRYLDAAKAKGGEWARDAALADALVYARDGKLDDARKALEAIDSGDGRLETSNDVRARFHLALVALAQNRVADAKSMVEQILAAQPEHLAAKALEAKLATKVSNTDPLPPEEGDKGDKGNTKPNRPDPPDVNLGGGYDQLLARANKLAETNCSKALEVFAKALEQKPNGVEALTGQGYCHIDAKQFASAFSKFRAALAISPRYEPALWGIAEAYQQQGRREQAIEAYKKYLEVYPGTAKAQKQLDRLTGGTGGGTGGTGGTAPSGGGGTTVTGTSGSGEQPPPQPQPQPQKDPPPPEDPPPPTP